MAALRRAAWLLLGVAVSSASAQQSAAPDPIVASFREYRAALERNDLPAAEKAAAAALGASEAANGARTAVLALNLANVRLELGEDYDALKPARTAHELASASSSSGVDARLAALTLGRAELAEDERGGSRRLIDAIAAAESDEALAGDVYGAAVTLGQWALGKQDYETAQNAWVTAGKVAGATADPTFARARALTGEGTAIFLRNAYPQEQQTGTRLTRISTPDAQGASDKFAAAQELLLPAAYAETPPGARLTAGQVAYAQAMAWQGALLARIESLDETLPIPQLLPSAPTYNRGIPCSLRAFNSGPEIKYPTEALFRYGVGAVVAHFALNPDGTIRGHTIAASVPPGPLGEAVEKTLPQWKVEKSTRAAANCTVPSSHYVMVRFVLE
jgi:hypothetical protein